MDPVNPVEYVTNLQQDEVLRAHVCRRIHRRRHSR